MNLKKELYEAPDAEEIVFTSLDAIALSYNESNDDEDDTVGDGWFEF